MMGREVIHLEIREIWGVSYTRIEAFFLSQDDVQKCRDGSFSFGDCRIHLSVLPEHVAGPLRFPRTQLVFNGSEQDTESIYHRFFLRFLSAGA